ncbi:UNVERIFIED_CONTAM: hypothetical protein GTU68_046181 [Idotea baltica]|nr:hypothetical protein [Idotea baltica]
MATQINDANFQAEVIESAEPVLVDFWAPWCGPCRALTPIIDELSDELAGSIKVGKVNVDESPEAATKYGISSIPAVLVFKGGEVVNTLIGVQSKASYQQAAEAAV